MRNKIILVNPKKEKAENKQVNVVVPTEKD